MPDDLTAEIRRKQIDALLRVILVSGLAGVGIGIGRELYHGVEPEDASRFGAPRRVLPTTAPSLEKVPHRSVGLGQYKFSKQAGEGDAPKGTAEPEGLATRLVKAPGRAYNTITNERPSIWSSPLTVPLLTAAGPLSLFAGAAGTSWLVNKYRKWRAQAELDEAREEYEELLKERYGLAKESALADRIESGFDKFEKSAAGLVDTLKGIGGGTALTVGGGVWLLAHLAALKASKDADKERARRKIFESHMRSRLAKSPPAVYFDAGTPKVEEEEEEKEGLPKLSSVDEDLQRYAQYAPNMAQADVQNHANILNQTAAQSASTPEAGQALISGLVKNKDAASRGVTKAMNQTIQGKLGGGMLGSLLGVKQ